MAIVYRLKAGTYHDEQGRLAVSQRLDGPSYFRYRMYAFILG